MNSYNIAGVNFTLKEDLTLDESEKLQKYFERLKSEGSEIRGGYTNDELKDILHTVLETKERLPEGFSFGQCKGQMATEIIRDFFLLRVLSFNAMQNSLASLISETEGQSNATRS